MNFIDEARSCGLNVIDYRSKWRHPTRVWSKRKISDILGLVVHQTAGGDSVDALGRYHTSAGVHIGDGQGLAGIAYTLFVNKAGELYLCNDLEDVTWSHGDRKQPGDENKMFMGVCFGGRFRAQGWKDGTEIPTIKQYDTLTKLWNFLQDRLGFTGLDLYGHYHFGKPTCPGDDLKNFIEQMRLAVAHNLNTAVQRQTALKNLGFDPGKIDGAFGSKSIDAMQAFQKAKGLPVTPAWTYLTTAQVYRTLLERNS